MNYIIQQNKMNPTTFNYFVKEPQLFKSPV